MHHNHLVVWCYLIIAQGKKAPKMSDCLLFKRQGSSNWTFRDFLKILTVTDTIMNIISVVTVSITISLALECDDLMAVPDTLKILLPGNSDSFSL